MKSVEIAFECAYCGERFDVECHQEEGLFVNDEYHGCFGETVGLVAEVWENEVHTYKSGDIRTVYVGPGGDSE